jgi:hypothetical protein
MERHIHHIPHIGMQKRIHYRCNVEIKLSSTNIIEEIPFQRLQAYAQM